MFKKAARMVSVLIWVGLLLGGSAAGAADTPPGTASPTHDPDYRPGEVMFQPAAPAPDYTPMAAEAVNILPWSRLVFQSYRDGNWEIYTANDDGSGVRRVTDHSQADVYPRLNRGATRLVFSSNRTGNYELFVMNPDGSALGQLTGHAANDYNPAWSPDSSRIAFNSYRDGQSEIYVVHADGANLTRLTYNAAYDGGPVWSPDGSKLAFHSDRSGGAAIWVMNADGSAPTILAAQPYAENPAWSPDGAQIAYDADGNGDGWQEVWVMNSDGSNQRQVYDPGEATADTWVRSWSPDGQYIAFTRINFTNYQGNWYWTYAYLDGIAPQTGAFVRLNNSSDVEWYPDWQTTDITAPTSQLNPLPAQSPAPFQVSWSGADVGPAGMRSFDVQVKDSVAGVWTDWQVRTSSTSAAYSGIGGHTYYFRVRAWDNAHNVEAWPGEYDAVTTVEAYAPDTTVKALPDYSHNDLDIRWGGTDPGNSGIVSYDVQYREGISGIWTDWHTKTLKTSDVFTGLLEHTYYFRVRATDRAQNAETWPVGDGDTGTTFYTWRIEGTVRDNTGVIVSDATINTLPEAFAVPYDNPTGAYAAYIADASVQTYTKTYTVTWSKPGYNALPATEFSGWEDTQRDVFLPPLDNLVQNWGFENGVWDLTDWRPSGIITPTIVTDSAHTGRQTALLGQLAGFAPSVQIIETGVYDFQWKMDKYGTMHLVWSDDDYYNHHGDIYYRQLNKSGVWSTITNISNTWESSNTPQIMIDRNGIMHVVWIELDPARYYYAQRDSNGVWSTPQIIPVNPWFADMTVDGKGRVHIVWTAGGYNEEIYYIRRETDGVLSNPQNISNTARQSIAPAIALDSNDLPHVVWQEDVPGVDPFIYGRYDVYYARMRSDGTWSFPLNVSNSPGGAGGSPPPSPRIAVDSQGIVHVFWEDDTSGTLEPYYAQRKDGAWDKPYIQSKVLGIPANTMSMDESNTLHIAGRNAIGVLYTRCDSNGMWAIPIEIADVNGSPIQLTVKKGIAHLLLRDSINVYYARRILDGKQSSSENISQIHDGWHYVQTAQLLVDDNNNPHIVWSVADTRYTGPALAEFTGDSAIAQVITIPIEMANPTLSFVYQFANLSGNPADGLSVQVDDGITTATVFSTTSNTENWTHRWVNLSEWAGQNITLTLSIHQTAGYPLGGVYLDEVTVGSAHPDLWMDKSGPLTTMPDELLIYQITYGNDGGAPAENVRMTDILPAKVTFVSADPMPIQGSTFLPPLTWNLGTLPANSGPFTIVLTATVAPTLPMFSTLTNTASITSSTPELELANNTTVIHVLVAHQLYLPLVTKN